MIFVESSNRGIRNTSLFRKLSSGFKTFFRIDKNIDNFLAKKKKKRNKKNVNRK